LAEMLNKTILARTQWSVDPTDLAGHLPAQKVVNLIRSALPHRVANLNVYDKQCNSLNKTEMVCH